MTFTGYLQLMFIALKLTNQIDWTWPEVLAPTIITWGLLLLYVLAGVIVGMFTKKAN